MGLRVSVVMTIKNEAVTLPDLLASLEQQTRKPDEIIVVDGGSHDGSVALLRTWQTRLPLRIWERPGASIAEGRNFALAQANGDIVAVTDGGVVLSPDWLERVTSPFLGADAPDVVSGFFEADPRSPLELALSVTTLPLVDEIDPRRFLPSSRSVAFRRSLFLAGLRYPSWLDYGEDVVFDLRLRRVGARFRFEPAACVRYRPRQSLRAFFWQYFHYARGDGKAGLFPARHLIRYTTYLVFLPLMLTFRRWWFALGVAGAAAYFRKPYRRLWQCRHRYPRSWVLRAFLLIPLVRFVGDVAKQLGYPFGLIWRWRRYGPRRTWRSIPEPMQVPFQAAGEGTRLPINQPVDGSPEGG